MLFTSEGQGRSNLWGSEFQMRSRHKSPILASFTASFMSLSPRNKNQEHAFLDELLPYSFSSSTSVLDIVKGNLGNLKNLIFHVRIYYIILLAITCLNLLQVWWILEPTRINVLYLETKKTPHIWIFQSIASITTVKERKLSNWVGRIGGKIAMLLKGNLVKQWLGNGIIWSKALTKLTLEDTVYQSFIDLSVSATHFDL